MRPEIIKSFLQENVINREVVLDRAYELLKKRMTSDQIERAVNKIVKKAKTEKDALERVERLKEKKKLKENVSFIRRTKKYLGEEAVEDVWERSVDEKTLNRIAQIIDRFVELEGDGDVEDWEVPSGEIKRLAIKNLDKIRKEVVKRKIVTDEFVKSVKGGNGWKGLIEAACELV